MRELEFLPAWYGQLLHRRRVIVLQAWLCVVVVGAVVVWWRMERRNETSARVALDSLRGQVLQATSQLEQMDRLERLQRQWRQQAEAMSRLGTHVESARLMDKIIATLPESVSLLDVVVDTEETAAQLSNVARSGLKDPNSVPLERKLRVKLQGVAPTDVELATLLTELNRVPFFDRVAPTYVKDRKESGHILREFELTFMVNLGSTAGG